MSEELDALLIKIRDAVSMQMSDASLQETWADDPSIRRFHKGRYNALSWVYDRIGTEFAAAKTKEQQTMIITTKDPHPELCLCHRLQPDANGYPQMVRCTGLEGHSGRCTFPPPPERNHGGSISNNDLGSLWHAKTQYPGDTTASNSTNTWNDHK